MNGHWKRARWIALGAALGMLLLAAAIAAVVAASGVLAARPGDWTVPLVLTRRHAIDLNVPGLVRLATTPLALRALDGFEKSTSFGRLRFAHAQDALVVECRPCRIERPRLASRALVLPAVELRLARRRGAEGNRLDGRLAAGEVRVDFVPTLRSHGIDIEWALPATDLAALLRPFGDAIPGQRHARIEGTLAARGALALPALRGSVQLQWENPAVDGLNTAQYAWGGFRHACRGADGTARWIASGDGERSWIALDALGPWLPAAVLAAEDQRFHEHAGIDRVELDAALAAFDASGSLRSASAPERSVRGASTLSQQLARTLFTGGERTLARKVRETLYAVECVRCPSANASAGRAGRSPSRPSVRCRPRRARWRRADDSSRGFGAIRPAAPHSSNSVRSLHRPSRHSALKTRQRPPSRRHAESNSQVCPRSGSSPAPPVATTRTFACARSPSMRTAVTTAVTVIFS
jgi:hypothetical protein